MIDVDDHQTDDIESVTLTFMIIRIYDTKLAIYIQDHQWREGRDKDKVVIIIHKR